MLFSNIQFQRPSRQPNAPPTPIVAPQSRVLIDCVVVPAYAARMQTAALLTITECVPANPAIPETPLRDVSNVNAQQMTSAVPISSATTVNASNLASSMILAPCLQSVMDTTTEQTVDAVQDQREIRSNYVDASNVLRTMIVQIAELAETAVV